MALPIIVSLSSAFIIFMKEETYFDELLENPYIVFFQYWM
jgi:hypothetical protein